jgi:hypothetical protein
MHCDVPLGQLAVVTDTRGEDAGFLVQYLEMALELRAPPGGAGGPATQRQPWFGALPWTLGADWRSK